MKPPSQSARAHKSADAQCGKHVHALAVFQWCDVDAAQFVHLRHIHWRSPSGHKRAALTLQTNCCVLLCIACGDLKQSTLLFHL